jgi:hypothetical protein
MSRLCGKNLKNQEKNMNKEKEMNKKRDMDKNKERKTWSPGKGISQ